MRVTDQYKISFAGLKLGEHQFQFSIGDSFFEAKPVDGVLAGQVNLDVMLNKQAHMLVCDLEFQGIVSIACDRCGDTYKAPFDLDRKLIVRFAADQHSGSDELIIIAPTAQELDLVHHIYEFISLGIPVRNIHPDGLCDPTTIARLESFGGEDYASRQKMDPRWKELEKLQGSLN